MNHSEISSFIWGTADLLRSSFKQHEYGAIILPFTVMRRLDVVLEPTKRAVHDAAAKPLPGALRDTMLNQAAGVDFYNTSEFTMRGLLTDADGIRENLSKYVTSFSPEIADMGAGGNTGRQHGHVREVQRESRRLHEHHEQRPAAHRIQAVQRGRRLG
ncbi:type I restriction-modification system subunit M N-terminal domain-containing protein [Adlercreutzia sp. ZJ242]|uniref:type I restriction-modification system subunit M N-terminal domain-containing protein n=1 Tax=Adlercreutzia sp. ZJ242 TaxID=2709409 RepID=UPI0013ED681C|nr:type I restriction-modification system subunit M N-terminal domain-containing protein [Adlercreutzia sp. ZJ242]